MLVLRSSPFSPFGRKVKIAAALCGVSSRIEVRTADTMDPNDTLRVENPLGKIPVLILEDGTTLFDSRVIVEYLDTLAGGGRIIPNGSRRFAALTLQALADGLMEASILQRYEAAHHPEEARSASWLDHQRGKVARALAVLEKAPPASDDLTIGGIATACALGYLDLRFEGLWRSEHPNLAAWLDAWAAGVPSFGATTPQT